MSKKHKYYYNITSLRYEKVEVSWGRRLLYLFAMLCTSLVFAILIVMLIQKFMPSANEMRLRNELDRMEQQYSYLNEEMQDMHNALESLRKRDVNVYRVLYESGNK